MAAPIPKLEFSKDALSVSNAAAAWIDVTRYCKSMAWSSGVTREFDDPQAGSATFVLKNMQRRFEPEYAAGAYYPNIVPGRRFRITVTADGVNYQQGIWYAQSWDVQYPDRGSSYSEVVVTCSDGFWRLALDRLGLLSPPSAQTYSDVILHDNPFAYYRLAEDSGKTLVAETGPQGTYRGYFEHGQANPVIGDASQAAGFQGALQDSYARAKMEDVNVFQAANQVSAEFVARFDDAVVPGAQIMGPWRAATTNYIITLANDFAEVVTDGVDYLTGSFPLTTGTHHFCLTFDGNKLCYYQDGSLVTSESTGGGTIITADANEYLYIRGSNHEATGTNIGHTTYSHVAWYDYALTPTQVSDHATAALIRGYAAQASGSRIAALATDSLWSTAGIPSGTVIAAARFQFGQTAADEITETARIEQPGSLFYLDDQGNPDYRALLDTQTVAAVFGDAPGEIQYDAIQLAYNDELFNTSTVAGEGLDGRTASNSQSISDYGVRAQDATGLIITNNQDAGLLSQAIVDRFGTPMFRCDSISLNGSTQAGRTQILTREVGDTIRVRRRGEGGTPIDIITRILQKQKSLDVNGDLRCTWTLARGFNAATVNWHLGVTGYSELGQTTVLG